MGFAHLALVAVSSILTALSSLVTVAEPNADHDQAFIETVVSNMHLHEFDRSRFMLRRQHRWFDWSTDGCSVPVVGNQGRSFNFTAACRRHDFGYRNLKLLDQRYNCPDISSGTICGINTWSYGRYWNAEQRLKLDEQFSRDMVESCATRLRSYRVRCEAWAFTFFKSVRAIGGP